jgi:gamma-glutamyltranspeptidase/glutathione hydrolase
MVSIQKRFSAALLALLTSTSLASAQPSFQEPTSVLLEGDQHQPIRSEKAMVVAGEEIATAVGEAILRRGGNAVDASVATALALAVTLPRAGNIGGGGFVLVRDVDNRVYALDFRETAPQALSRNFYLQPGRSSTRGPSAAGVPGTVAGLWEVHQRFGKMPWSELVAPAQKLAGEGFSISAYESEGISSRRDSFKAYPSTAAVFLPGGNPPAPMQRFRQADLAETLGRIASGGAEEFYRGETARRIAKSMAESGGVMTTTDLASYKAVWREPVSTDFRGFQVYSMPPPSSGGVHLMQMLEMVEDYPTQAFERNSAQDIHRLTEVMRVAYADRARYLGDPDFVDVPVTRLLSPDYLREREALINPERAGDSRALAPELFNEPPAESFDTTHFNVVDDRGMGVSLTYTLNFSFGSDYVAQGTGILMNNEMDDFNVKPGEPNSYGLIGGESNKVEAGKRPISSMTPTIVTKDGQLIAVLGAPGGSRIITGVFEWLLNFLAFGFNPQTSASLPRTHHQWYPDALGFEVGISADTRKLLEAMGHKLEKVNAVAHVLAIVRQPDGHLEAGLDPRRPAFAKGY